MKGAAFLRSGGDGQSWHCLFSGPEMQFSCFPIVPEMREHLEVSRLQCLKGT